jgi:hypothetical protein
VRIARQMAFPVGTVSPIRVDTEIHSTPTPGQFRMTLMRPLGEVLAQHDLECLPPDNRIGGYPLVRPVRLGLTTAAPMGLPGALWEVHLCPASVLAHGLERTDDHQTAISAGTSLTRTASGEKRHSRRFRRRSLQSNGPASGSPTPRGGWAEQGRRTENQAKPGQADLCLHYCLSFPGPRW